MSKDHFQGKGVLQHLKETRAQGARATAEIHGVEVSGHFFAATDSAKETSFLLLLLGMIFPSFYATPSLMWGIALGWLIWKTGRSAFLGWARLERLHRLIEEERWEIEHNREQEREELTALYHAKGLRGPLLEEVISIFMADDNRLLRIMLEEELGLTLELYEHPLKQSLGAALGVLLSFFLFFLGSIFSPQIGPFVASAFSITLFSFLSARREKNRRLEAVIWSLSLAACSSGVAYFITR